MSFSKNAALAMLTKMGLEDDDVEDIHTIASAIFKTNIEKRNVKWRYKRLNWEEHIEMLRHTNSFQSRYHMSESSFSRLIDILCDKITFRCSQPAETTLSTQSWWLVLGSDTWEETQSKLWEIFLDSHHGQLIG